MKNSQVGGVVSFVIVAIALAGLLGGGLYFSKQMGRDARLSNDSAPQIATPQKQTPEQKTEEKKSEQKPAEPVQQGATNTDRTPAATPATPSRPSTSPQTSSDRVAVTGPSDSLPATGPSETALFIVVSSIMVFTLYRLYLSHLSYVRSALNR